MILDFYDHSAAAENLQADICVIGAGAAGITIAHSFLGTDTKVCLLESGGWGGDDSHQSLNDGQSCGPTPFTIRDSRLRAFGGSCNIWGGGCIPLARSVWNSRDWVPHSGWPIAAEELEPYYPAARSLCGISSHEFVDGSSTSAVAHDLPQIDDDELAKRVIAISPVMFGKRYRQALIEAPNVTVLLHASALRLESDDSGQHIRRVHLGSLSGRRSFVAARHFVISSGALENARLLLLSGSQVGRALGEAHSLVGRFLMDHPSCTLGHVTGTRDEWHRRQYRVTDDSPALALPELELSDASARRRRLLAARVRTYDVEGRVPGGLQALRQLRSVIGGRTAETPSIENRVAETMHGPRPRTQRQHAQLSQLPAIAGRALFGLGDIVGAAVRRASGKPAVRSQSVQLVGYFEQAPNFDSRLTLDSALDAFGQPRARVDWQLTSLDYETYQASAAIFGSALANSLGGQFTAAPWLRDPASLGAEEIVGTSHHMGTTRMSTHPQGGVVDPNCQVFGTANLHISGSSVFPAAGWEFPTFTIVALSLRLADRLQELLSSAGLATA